MPRWTPFKSPSNLCAPRKVPKIVPLLAFTLACRAGLLADTPSRIRSVDASECYCRCAEGHTRAGCAKMCELPKYAKRWWATTCVKPRYKRPAEDSNAGPHLRHPDRGQHAQL